MATDTFDVYQPALFDVDEFLLGDDDRRSVGEMLWDADRGARELLADIDGDDAAGLLRGWPAVIAASLDVWHALPDGTAVSPRRVERLDQLRVAGESATRSMPHGWPSPGAIDSRMSQIAGDLSTAATLVRRFGQQPSLYRLEPRRDVTAARTRAMHTLYVATHAVTVALHQRGQDMRDDAKQAGDPIPEATRHPEPGDPGRWITRLRGCESMAADYITGHVPGAFEGEARPAPVDTDRMERALTRWDLQVHRTLARTPEATNIEAVARTEAGIASCGQALIEAATRNDDLAPPMLSQRLPSALTHAARAWRGLAGRWSDLRTPTTPPDPALARAAAEVRAAFRELTHDATTMAPLEVIADRPGTGPAAAALVNTLEASAARAVLVAEQADNPHLTGPARALSLRAHNDADSSTTVAVDEDAAWVSPADIVAKREIPLPPPVADGLRSASHLATATAATAATAFSADNIHGSLTGVERHESRRAVAAPRPDEAARTRDTPRNGVRR